ncbi:MAG: DsbA family protein [Nanoarchaeota archaeon]
MTEHEQHKNETLTIKKDTLWKGAVAVLAVLFVISLFTGGFGMWSGGSNPGNNDDSGSVDTSELQISITDKDPVLGSANAAVSIVEFSDFECPFCARAYLGPISDFKGSEYFKNGDVNLVFKQFPLTQIHPSAQKAAEASLCAFNQGNDNFWEYHDLLFENQDKLGISSLKVYAETVGLNTATFNKCLDNDEAADKVSSDTQEAIIAGGQGTPYFVVINNKNGKTGVVSGAVPYNSKRSANSPAGLEQVIGEVQ